MQQTKFFTAVLFASVASGAVADPIVSVVGGTIEAGNVVTVSGAGFGNDGDELPIIFDNFESGSPGASLGTGPWSIDTSNGPDDPTYSTSFAFGGSNSGYVDARGGGDSAAFISGMNTDRIYASFRFRYRMNGSPVTQKGFRAHADDGPNIYTSYPGVFVQDYATSNRLTVATSDDSSDQETLYGPPNLSQNSWHRLEYFFSLSSPSGSSSGVIWASHDLRVVQNSTSILTRSSGVSDRYNVAILPFYFGNGGGGELWYDDVYISKSRARVEIGNSSSWDQSSRRSIQVPVSWSSSTISVRLNLNGFSASDELFLFVVDRNGSRSSGVRLADVVRPLPPSQLN